MTEIQESRQIQGVKTVRLESFTDERGRFLETFRKEWFPECSWEIVQRLKTPGAPRSNIWMRATSPFVFDLSTR